MRGDLTYRGIRLIIPPTADITKNFFGRHKPLVQEALDAFADDENDRGDKPWGKDDRPIFTLEGLTPRDGVNTNVVALGPGERGHVLWAVHADHKADTPGLSPFVKRPVWPSATTLTIELAGTSKEPWLVRVYASRTEPEKEYRPPLPWMGSAQHIEGGRDVAVQYWRHHAYIWTTTQVTGPVTRQPPDWFV